MLRAPSPGRPKPVVTYEASFHYRGWETTPEAYNTVARLTLPRGVTVESVSPSQCGVRGRVVRCAFGTVPTDEIKTVKVRTRVVRAKVGDHLGATLVAWADNVDRNPGGGYSENMGPNVVDNTADLEVDLTSSRESVAPGAEMSYGVRAINNGPLTNAPAAFIIKPGPQLVNPSVSGTSAESCTRTSEGFRCPFVQHFQVNMSGTVSEDAAGSTLSTSFTAEFTGEDPPSDPNPANNTVTETTEVEHRADLGLAMSVTPDSVPASDLPNEPVLTYRAVVTNAGPGKARRTRLNVHRLNRDYGIESVSVPDGCTYDRTVECDAGDLPVGGSREFTFQAKATPKISGEVLEAWAEVTAANDEFDRPNDNQKTVYVKVPGNHADLGVQLGAEPNPILAGKPVTLVAKAVNHGPLPKADSRVRIRTSVPLGDARIEVEGGTCRIITTPSDLFECTIPQLSGEAKDVKLTGVTALQSGERLTVNADIDAAENTPVDNNYANDRAMLNIPVAASPARAGRK
ncbi:COG1361 family protein [Actinomadura rudentiformis]|uniref:DUF11 domain-containing protein n=1 Tax=Actinomadura rudentiformis TaxID=359158 RepID=A0A6H9Z673_9ACTN|nr:DUF11 domain-containing protein [Actinomadura rudentiformis]KAB2350280.1 hypothetical protein F8566_10895 [Actinomadura rudentiformis]